jgi:hypothetical protein
MYTGFTGEDARIAAMLIAGDAEWLWAARLEVMRGYERAVRLVSQSRGAVSQEDAEFFEQGLSDARELAGLPRLRVLAGGAPLPPATGG